MFKAIRVTPITYLHFYCFLLTVDIIYYSLEIKNKAMFVNIQKCKHLLLLMSCIQLVKYLKSLLRNKFSNVSITRRETVFNCVKTEFCYTETKIF